MGPTLLIYTHHGPHSADLTSSTDLFRRNSALIPAQAYGDTQAQGSRHKMGIERIGVVGAGQMGSCIAHVRFRLAMTYC
jgi:hypothetical protein